MTSDDSAERSAGPAAAGSRLPRTPDEFRAWLKELRTRSGLSLDQLGDAVGLRDRRQPIRYEKEGTEPGGLVLLKILDALGVRLEPAPPEELPRAINAELAEVRREVRELRSDVATLTSRLDRTVDVLAALVARLEPLVGQFEDVAVGLARQAEKRHSEKASPERAAPATIEKHYSTREVAELLGVSTETIRRLARRGELRSMLIGNDRRYDESALRDLLERSTDSMSRHVFPSLPPSKKHAGSSRREV